MFRKEKWVESVIGANGVYHKSPGHAITGYPVYSLCAHVVENSGGIMISSTPGGVVTME